jgi:hypothetical protein
MIDVLKDLCGRAGVMKIWTVTNRSNQAAVRLYGSTGARPGPGDDDVIFVWEAESWKSDR